MARESLDALLKRTKKAWDDKEQWRAQLQDAYTLALPMRNLYNQQSRGVVKNDVVFDSTLPNSTVRFANKLQSELVPPFQKWMNLVIGSFFKGQLKEEQRREFQLLLNQVRDRFFAILRGSNFDTAVNEFFLDLAVGTGIVLVVEGNDDMPINFVCVPQFQVALEAGAFGTVGAVYRKHMVVARNIPRMWRDIGEGKDARKPRDWEKWLDDNSDKDVEVSEATYLDIDREIWWYDVVIKGAFEGGKRKGVRIVTREYPENPFIVSRWIKAADEVQGRGPVLFALPDAKVLNKVKELVLKNASLAISGVWTVTDDGVLNPANIVIRPGVIIPVRSNGGGQLGPSIQQLEFKGKFDVAQLIIADLNTTIKTAMMDNQLPPDEGPVKSATEVIAKIKELQQDIGSPFGRMKREFINPLIQRTLNLMIEAGLLNIPGVRRFRVDGTGVDVEILSSIAQAQNISDVESTVNWMEMNNALIGPQIFGMAARLEDFPALSAEKLGIDPKLLRSVDEKVRLQQMAELFVEQTVAAQGGVEQGTPQRQAA